MFQVLGTPGSTGCGNDANARIWVAPSAQACRPLSSVWALPGRSHSPRPQVSDERLLRRPSGRAVPRTAGHGAVVPSRRPRPKGRGAELPRTLSARSSEQPGRTTGPSREQPVLHPGDPRLVAVLAYQVFDLGADLRLGRSARSTVRSARMLLISSAAIAATCGSAAPPERAWAS